MPSFDHPIHACVSYLSAMILLFLDLKETLFIPPRVEDHNELHSTPQSHCKEPIPKI
jgi:hypothetical protein